MAVVAVVFVFVFVFVVIAVVVVLVVVYSRCCSHCTYDVRTPYIMMQRSL